MNSTLQELTDKIYNEGVAKGQKEAEGILTQANKEAQEIIEKAKKNAQRTKDNAEKEALILKKNVESEVKLFASQAVNALKTTVTDLICNKIASDSVKAATADKAFMQGIISKMTQAWIDKGEVTIQTSDAALLNEYFIANAKEILNNGLNIEEVKGLKTSFSIAPANSTYKITIGDDEFIEYFKEFVRPKLKELLF